MRKSLLVGIVLFALALAMPSALCAMPSPPAPGKWPPDPVWSPKSPEEARPKLKMIKPWWNRELLAGEPFYLITGWHIPLTNIAWDAETGEPVVPYENVQDGTGSATVIFDELTMNGEPLGQPTYSYKAICRWFRWYNDPEEETPPPFPEGEWIVVLSLSAVEHYYVFPNGLPAGEYQLHVHAIFPGIGEFNPDDGWLHVIPAP